jgi:sirohydrochlorin ferrochelatase
LEVKTGYVVFAHGSRLEAANDSVRAVASELAREGGFDLVEIAFLDCAPPGLATALDRLAAQGAEQVIVLPYFLTPGRHTAEDLPRLAAEASGAHPGLRVEIAASLDGHPALPRVLLERARAALG